MSDHDALLNAARGWRDSLIPKTSTAAYRAARTLLSAIERFDPTPCAHPRSWHVYYPEDRTVCGYCGHDVPNEDPDKEMTDG